MNLKRSDKIIAAVGVIILIIAAIGIILYVESEDDVDEISSRKEIKYEVEWTHASDSLDTITGNVGRPILQRSGTYTKPFEVTVPDGNVLTKVDVCITWNDDNKYGLQNNKGLDELTAKFTYGEATETHKKTGSGNETFTFTIYDAPEPLTEVITDAESMSDAKDMVLEDHKEKNTASFETKITVKIGETLFRPLKYMKDKGNNFKIHVTYYCYTLDINEIENDVDEDKETSLVNLGFMGGKFTAMNFAGFH
jgi:hypothetical protein